MRTEVNIFFALLFVCSFIVSVAFTNDKNESDFSSVHKVNGEFDVYTNSSAISSVSTNNETYETVAPPSSDTSSMHGKIGEYEVYHEHVNIKTVNLQPKYPPLPTRFFHSNERTLFYKTNEQMSYNLINKIDYFPAYFAIEKHYLEQNSSR